MNCLFVRCRLSVGLAVDVARQLLGQYIDVDPADIGSNRNRDLNIGERTFGNGAPGETRTSSYWGL